MRAKFVGNSITCLQFFVGVQREREREKKNKENERLFEGLYFRNGWRNLLQIWYVFSPNKPAPAKRIWFCLIKKPRSYEHT